MPESRTVACALIAAAAGAALAGAPAASQTGAQADSAASPVEEGWTTLLDGESLEGWNRVGEANWRVEDGAVVADSPTGETPAFLVTPDSYGDFELEVEFWASDDANSGVFFRCADPEQITAMTCYEANVFDQREDPIYGTGAIVNHAGVDPMPKAGGQWNTMEITANGHDSSVALNGETTAELRSNLLAEGPIALQHRAGTVKFREVRIRPLLTD